MSNPDSPTDPQQLRVEIEETRADLGETVEQLTAKADVKSRAKEAAGDARQKLTDKTAHAAGVAAETISGKAAEVKQQLAESDLPAPVRRPLPLAAIGAAATAVIALIVLGVRRRRS